jgi:chromosome segregation ATPase
LADAQTKFIAAQQELVGLGASYAGKLKQLNERLLVLETEHEKSLAERHQLRMDLDQVRHVMKQTRSECDLVMQEVFRLRREVFTLKATCKHLETLHQTPPRR